MNALLDFLGGWLADYYLFSTLLLATALLAVAVMRQPARKLAVIRAAVIGLFLLAGLCALPNWSSVHLTRAPSVTPVDESSAATAIPVRIPAPVNRTPEDPTPLPLTPTSTVATSEIEKSAPAATTRNVTWLIVWTFLVGTVLIASWLALGAWQLARLSRESEPAPKEILALLERIAGPVALLPRLRITSRLPSAVAMGIGDSTILIPRVLAEKSDPEKLGSVLAHEWAHVRNGDLRLLASVRVLMLFLWAHPLYWILRLRVRLEQELLADAAAAERTNRRDYAAQLVDWARHLPAAPHAFLAASVGIWEGPSQLRRRVALLLDDEVTLHPRCSRTWQLTAGSLCALAALALSFLTLRPAAIAAAIAAEAAVEAEVRDEAAPSKIVAKSDDYQKILGRWEVVSVKGSGGRFMDLDDQTKPGDFITIPHVRAPGPDYVGPTKVYMKSPFVTRWLSPEIQRKWSGADSLYLYPDAAPKRCTYKSKGGTKGHFSDPETPPDYAIYRFEGDTLTLLIGDPEDFEVNEGQESNLSSAGTVAKWTWRLAIPNYPDDFKFEPGKRRLLVTLKRAAIPPAPEHPGDKLAAATLEAHRDEIKARRSQEHSEEERKAWYERSLIKLSIALDQSKDPDLRKSFALAALGYANSLSKYETSVKLVHELIEYERDDFQIARWFAELGEIYDNRALLDEDPPTHLQKSNEAYTEVIRLIESSAERESPQAYRRLILTYAKHGNVVQRQFELGESASHKEQAVSLFRSGAECLAELRAHSASGKQRDSDSGGHGDSESYSSVLENLLFLRYDEHWFSKKVAEMTGE